ncbi:MAG: serine hydrolase [Acidobacteriaceae bacterium]|nr:serine hydrolase [Acidobacteriaceae bacterium]
MRTPLVALFLAAATLSAQAQLSPEAEAKINALAEKTLHDTGVPSASVAIAQNGKLVYAHAFGLANVAPARPATAQMAYPIGSISKQFTAQAALLLAQDGKLSIDDPVAKYFPNLTRAKDVTLRNLMTMTSGYQDFAPQDYIIPAWLKPTTPLAIVQEWATKPLDFEPGSEWQYSNTNYVLLGLILEKVSGEPLSKLVHERVLAPLGISDQVFNTYTDRQKLQVTGYVSNALAPVRVQPLEANGWYFGDGDLAMTASTLITWDLGILNQKLLSPASYKQFETPFVYTNGKPSTYGLGVFVHQANGHPMLEHSGEVGGYVAENMLFPDDKIAITVLTNQVASEAASEIGHQISLELIPTLRKTPPAETADTLAPTLKTLLPQLQNGTIDTTSLTPDTIAYFSPETLADFKSTLAPLGALKEVTRTRSGLRGGMTFGLYKAAFANGTLTLTTYLTPEGKIEQLLIIGKE